MSIGLSRRVFAIFFLVFVSTAFSQAYALPNLSLGPFGPGVQDGSAPFNEDGNCANTTDKANAGDDCGENNNQIRSQDSVVFNWSITANNYTPGQTNPQNVIFEQILHTSTNAVVNFERIPARCTPAGDGGSNPASSITTENNGDIKLVCNLGEFKEGAQVSFSTFVKVSGESWNGESFTSTQQVYSNADDGTPNTTTSVYPEIGPIEISARPMMDLSSSSFRGYYLYGDKDVGNGPEPGYWTWVNMRLASPKKSGTEAIKKPFDYIFNLSATKDTEDGADYTKSGFEYYMHDCYYNTIGWGDNVYGRESYGASDLTNYPLKRKVIESGDCSFTRSDPADPASPYNISIDNTDLSGNRYPTETIGGTDLKAGPYYYMDMLARFFIPMRVIDNEDGVMDGVGSIYIKNILANFDPIGVSGVANYNGLKEPGFDGRAMPDGAISNNIAPAYNYYLTTRGTWSDYAFRNNNDTGTGYSYFVPSSSHSGQGLLAPTQAYANTLHFGNNGSNELSHPRACLVFDNTIQKLVDRSKIGASAGTYAYVGTYNGSGFDSTNYIVEYGHVDLSGDDPLDKDGDGINDYNNQSGRFEGNWDKAGNIRCADNVTTWVIDPTQVGAGIDDVNIVRVRLKDAVKDTVTLSSSQYIRFITPLEARQTFYQGPHNGEIVPMGAVLAGFGSVRSDEWAAAWTPAVGSRPYKPSPESGNTDGDRVTLARTTTQLDSESLLPLAAPGKTNSTIAGKQIVWKVNTAIQSLLETPSDEENVVIIDELPPEVSYNKSCTFSYKDEEGNIIGTPADLVKYNTDRNGDPKQGYTQLIWNIGTVTANNPIAPRVICTDSDALAPNGTSVVNYAEIRGDTLISALAQRSDTHTITLEQIGSIQVSKKVDLTLDDVNDDQVYTLSWANFAPSFAIDAPTIIDVLPFNGDDGANSTRTPASNFHGVIQLIDVPSVTWIGGGTDGEPLGTWYYSEDDPATINHDPDNNNSNWLTKDQLNGNFSKVTALKFVSNYKLEKDGDPHQGMKATYTLQAGDTADPNSVNANKPSDLYTNIFSLDTDSLPAEQFLTSNPVSVQVAAYSIGDMIFADVNGNGKYDAGIDGVVPDGVKVELYKVENDGSEIKVTETTTGKGALSKGRYIFEPLLSGTYYVKIPATEFQPNGKLDGWDIAPPTGINKENDDKNEDIDQHGYTDSVVAALGVRTGTIELSAKAPDPGEVPSGNEPLGDNVSGIVSSVGDDFTNLTLDIGLKSPLSSLGNMVWVDANNNGLQDVGETGLSNVVVNLLDKNGNQQQTTRTDNDGYYNFSNLVAGDYIIEVIKPAGYAFSPKDAGSDDTADSDTDSTTGRSDVIIIGFGQHDTQWDSGLYKLGSIGDRVWVDTNNDGIQDLTETAGLANVAVILKDSAGTEITRMDTDADGKYLFTGLAPADYIIDIDETDADLVGYTLTTANDPITHSLAAGENYLAADFGYINYGSVGDYVWHDANGNGVQEADEAGIAGVTVRLLDSTGGAILKTTTTDANGAYLFSDVPPEDYIVEFVKPNDYTDFVTANLGGDDATDSDATQGTGRTAVFTLAAGQSRSDIDAGLYKSASLGNFLWLDEDGNNAQTAGESGLAGISVDLSGNLGNGQLYQTLDNTTDANGQYQFSNLYPGTYTVSFNTNGFVTPDQGDDALDSDVAANGKVTVTLASGDNNQTIDAGIAAASVTGRVWIDNSTQNAIDEGTAIEAGVVGVTVNLIDPATGDTVATTTTGADGVYNFTGIKPANYLIEVVEPANMGFVAQNQGDDLSDSDVSSSSGRTEVFSLAAGQSVTDIDAGIEPGSLGDHVALDLNNNGIQDAGEPGVEGIVVTLIDANGVTVDTKTTDATGFYNFTGVTPANYTVHFAVPANMSLATANVGSDDTVDFDADANGDVTVVVVSGQGDQTIDAGIVPATLGDTVWFDKNGNGIQDATETGIADIVVTLVDSNGDDVNDAGGNVITTTTDANGKYSFNVLPASYAVKFVLPTDMAFTTKDAGDDTKDSDADIATGITTTVTLASGDTDNSLDAGIAAATISGSVLSDANGNGVQEAADTAIKTVTLTLSGTDIQGNPVEITTTTDANGAYQFNVLAGTYSVVETNPVGLTSSGAEQGTVGSSVLNSDTISVTVKNGEASENNDFLDYQAASLSGQVREDSNGDGDTTTAGDTGIAGVEIILWKDSNGDGTADVVYANTTTNGSGDYSFNDIPPGSYVVIETDLVDYTSTADTDAANDNHITVTLASGETTPNHDFLDTRPANISGQVRLDDDRDGDLNDTEKGIAGLTITLYTDPSGDGDPADGVVVTTTTTNAQGDYQFNNVLPSNYVVVETDGQATTSTADITGANDNRVKVTLVANTDSTNNDFLDASERGSLSGVVWADSDANGTQNNATEAGIPNVTVLVKGAAGNIVATLTTDENGAYSATNLDAGNYTVEIVVATLPSGVAQTGDPDSSKDNQTVAAVTAGNNTDNLDFGYVESGSIGDFVWHDINANGIQDANEVGIANVTVKLLNAADNSVLATTTTDATGQYQFTGLMQGDYKVEFIKPDIYATFTVANQGNDTEKDSEVIDAATGQTTAITLTAGETKTGIDAGLVQAASVGDVVWFDLNNNGLQDTDEPNVSNVEVKLTGTPFDGSVFVEQSTTTDTDGKYLFNNLLPGDYVVAFVLTDGMSVTTADQGTNDNKDSDAAADGKASVSLASGQTNLSIDAGILPAEVTGRVWIDNNTQNGIDEGAANENGVIGVNVNLIDTATGNVVLSTTTGADGIYTFTGVLPAEYIVEVVEPANMGFVAQDQGADDAVDSDVDPQNGRSTAFTVNSGDSVTDIDAGIEPGELGDHVWLDENNNGIQDSGEAGVADVTVTLTDANGTVVGTQTTDATGFYNFTGVLPADYTIHFTLPNGMDFVEQDRGTDDSLDSDVDVNTGNVAVTVISGVGNQTIDAGVIPATIGDTVWFDKDNDGLQGDAETMLAGLTVNLLDTNGNPVNDAGGNAVTTTTDENGKYSFTVLPGSYAIEIAPPVGVMLTGKDAGDDEKDSDVDPATKKSDTVTVVSGDNLTTLDAGIKPATISGSVITDNNANGTEDADDTVKIPNATVTITGTDVFGNPVTETVTTDENGNYTANVPPGTYTVTETTPDGYTSTGSEAGTVGSTIVDPDTLSIIINSGESSENNDFLERLPASLSGQVREDANGDGDIADTNDTGIAGVEIILWSDTDGDGNPDAVVANTTTNATGNYEFTNLAPANYIVVESDPVDTVSTADTDADNDNKISVTLSSGEQSPNHDFIDTKIANISGQVRDDTDRNGVLTDTESGISGVTVTLYTDPNGDGKIDDGVVVATDGTDAQGNYLFTGIVPAHYVIVESDPKDYESTADSVADNDNIIPVTHVSGQDSIHNDFLDTSILGSLSGVIWSDSTPDGIKDTATEAGIPTVTVIVKDAQGVTVATLTTGADGAYKAENLPAGNYTVEVDPTSLPAGALQTGDPDENLDHQGSAVVVSGKNTPDLDFGYVIAASLGDKVWEDLNADGIQDADEPPIAGAAVTLMMAGKEVATTLTDAEGLYHFTNLKPAEYEVIFTTPANHYPTRANAGTDDTVDSDGASDVTMQACASGMCATVDTTNSKVTVTLASGENSSIDAGFYQNGNLGDQVWLDWNSNGVQDADEPAVSDMVVNLLNADGTPTKDMDGNAISTTTDADGQYHFDHLKPADYLVEFVAPNGIVFTTADQGDDASDSDAQANGQAPATVTSNQTNDTVDAGILPAAVAGRVWIDNNTANAVDDGTDKENGVVGVTVNLIDSSTGLVVATTTTGAEGEYSFTAVQPSDYLIEVIEPVNMELVTKDQGSDDTIDSDVNPADGRSEVFTLTSGNTVTDIDAGILPGALGDHVFLDANENGLQDSGEAGVEGVTVNLLDSTGATVDTQITDVTGFYNFNAELPGEYTVEFVLPNGMAFTAQNTGSDDTIDSDADTSTGKAVVTVVSGVTNQTVDAGIIPAKIGDTVWLDKDGDGTQGGTEPTIANVTVTLLDAAGEPAKDKGGNVITTTTDASGHYQFIVEPATYGVQFTLPENTEFTTLDSGSNDAADSDADLQTGKTASITVNSGDTDMSLDAGIKPASIAGKVLQDNNGDAAEDADDTVLVGATVTLQGTDVFGNPVSMTTTTDISGGYQFIVPPGSYLVTETNPETYTSSVSEAGTIGSTIINKDILNIDVKSGEDSQENDFLDYQVASLSGQVREDMNGDADTTTATDPAIDAVEVILWRDSDGDGVEDSVFANTVTDASGNYSFTELPPGAYIVIETDKDGFKSTADTTGDNDNKIAKVLASGEDSPNHDFLDTRPTIISGQVREDEDRDGDLADTDNPLNGVTVMLYSDPNGDGNPDDGQPVATTTTDENGNYHFDDVIPSNYVIVETDPENYGSTGDTNGEPTDNIISVTNVSGENNTGNDLLDTKLLGTIAGTVWDDENADGVKDSTEPKFPTVTVVLLDKDGNEVASTTTNGAGEYQFIDLIPADYTVVIKPDTLPANSQQTGDPDPSKDHQHTVTVAAQTDVTNIDFGYVVRSSIGNKVWHDINANGVQDADELGIKDVKVFLLTDANAQPIATTTTNADGEYLFDKLLPANYLIKVEMPVEYDHFSQMQAGSDAQVDSDVNAEGLTTAITLSKAQDRTDIDAGVYAYASVGNTVWLDKNDDDLQQDGEPGVENIAVTLTGTNAEGTVINETTQTDVNGHYNFDKLVPGDYELSFAVTNPVAKDANNNASDAVDSDIDANGKASTTLTSGEHDDSIDAGIEKGRIGSKVWEDMNGDGIQDADEAGIAGVVVTLYSDPNGDGNPEDGEVIITTASDASGNYSFDGLLPDDYVLVFTTPENFYITPQDQKKDDAVDSDINPQGQVAVKLTSGEINTIDAGFYQLGSVGDRVWLDENNNGLQDTDEPSVSDIPVALYDLTGTLMTDANGVEYKTITDANGNYRFDNLIPSEYQVRFTVPEGITFTQTDYGTDDASDSDANANGQATAVIRSGEHNPTVDVGLTPAAITGRIWIDNNTQNNLDDSKDDENGLVGMVVNLLNEAGEIIQSTTTGSDGIYTFDAVLPDKYQIEFVEPEGMRLVQPDQGNDDTIDSDADVVTGRTPLFDITSGAAISNMDAGIEPGAVGDRVWLDANENGIQDADEIGVADIKVHLLDAQSLTIASTVTDENGFYSFKDVVPATYTILFERPTNMHFVDKDKGDDDALDSDVDVNGAAKITVHSGTSGDQTIDAGIIPAFIGDTVWLDSNVDDLQSEGEKGLQGITVLLNDKQGNTVDTTVTDADGHYSFAVIPNDYQVLFIAPDSSYSKLNKGNNDTIDSDADETGLSHIITVESGEKDNSVDAGILPAVITGKVLDDKNANGVKEAGDTPVANVTITLTGTDSYGNPVTMTTTTNDEGVYEIIVPPGSYTITETNPENFVSSNDDVLPISVVSTDISENNDFLDYQLVSISGSVQDDKDGDISASEGNTPLVNTDVTLWTDPNGDGDKADGQPIQIVPTNEQGQYLFENVVPGNYIVAETDPTDYVSLGELVGQGSIEGDYLDGSTGADVNNNELPLILVSGLDSIENNFFDARPVNVTGSVKDDEDYDGDFTDDDPALAGVSVSLYADPQGNGDLSGSGDPIATAITDDQGNYLFEGIYPGLYVIVETDPADYNSTADSGLDGQNNNRIPVIIFSGNDVTGQNFLDSKPFASLTGQVQNDTDGDGDTTDPDNGVAGVTVELWSDPNGDGNIDDGEKIGSTITDESGNYSFTDIIVGNYVITEIDRPGYLSTGDGAQANDNQIPVVVSMDEEQHCRLPSLLRSNKLDSCTGLDFVDREKVTTLTVTKKAYKGHDAGAKCGTDEAKDEIVLVDIDKDLQEPVTFCFEVTNTGENYLSNIALDDSVLGINQSAMTPLNTLPTALAPNASVVYYYEVNVTDTMENTVAVSAEAATEEGTAICANLSNSIKPAFCSTGAKDNSKATVHFVFDPPSAIKTVTETGRDAMVWKMVWINSSPMEADVELYDGVPEGTHYYPIESDTEFCDETSSTVTTNCISVTGVYCDARGDSVTDRCEYQQPTVDFPRGRVFWSGSIAGDVGSHTEEDANNEVVIRMMTVLDNNAQGQEITNQAHSSWDLDGDGEKEFEDVPSSNGKTEEPTTIKIGNAMKIPSVSVWGLLLMSLMIGLLGAYRRKR